jgi:hypothetical protein
MRLSWRLFTILVGAQFAVLAVSLAHWFYVRTSTYLAHPHDGDLYAHTWSFQFLACSLYFGGAAIAFGAIVFAESVVYDAIRRRMARHS